MFGANKDQNEKLREEQEAIVAEAQAQLDIIKKNHEGILVAIELDKEHSTLLKKSIKEQRELLSNLINETEQAKVNAQAEKDKELVLRSQVDSLEQQKKTAKAEIDEVISKKESTILDAISDIEIRHAKAQEELDGVTSAIASAELHFDVFNEKMIFAKDELEDTEQKVASQKIKLSQLQIDITEKEQSYEAKVFEAEQKLEELSIKLVNVALEKDSLVKEIYDHRLIKEEMVKYVDSLKKEKQLLGKEVAELLANKDLESQKLIELQQELIAIRKYDRYVSAKEDHLRGVASELGVEYKEYKAV